MARSKSRNRKGFDLVDGGGQVRVLVISYDLLPSCNENAKLMVPFMKFKLPTKLERIFAVYSTYCAKNDNQKVQEIIVNSRYRVVEE